MKKYCPLAHDICIDGVPLHYGEGDVSKEYWTKEDGRCVFWDGEKCLIAELVKQVQSDPVKVFLHVISDFIYGFIEGLAGGIQEEQEEEEQEGEENGDSD